MKKIALVLWTICSLYLCVGGITNIIINTKFEEADKLPVFKDSGLRDKSNNWFRNIEQLDASNDYEKMTAFYPMYKYAGETFSYILTLMAFGILGTLIKILIAISFGKSALEKQNVYTLPMLGALLGILILIISDLLPEFKYKSGNDKLFYCMSLLAGLFTKQFFTWLENKFKTIFK
jgi:hypothetical protein